MARKKYQESSSFVQYQTERAALELDSEADVYREDEDAGLSAQQWQAQARRRQVVETLGVFEASVGGGEDYTDGAAPAYDVTNWLDDDGVQHWSEDPIP